MAVYIEIIADSLDNLRNMQTEVQTELVRSKLNVDKLMLRQQARTLERKAAEEARRMLAEEELDAVRKLHREAQWFFDFCYVENSEGAHNSDLSMHCLDKAEELIDAGMKLLDPSAE